jgi:hypothetical protein
MVFSQPPAPWEHQIEAAQKRIAALEAEVKALRGALLAWRDDAYPCQAATCKCESKWHMRVGPTGLRVERTDAALKEAT